MLYTITHFICTKAPAWRRVIHAKKHESNTIYQHNITGIKLIKRVLWINRCTSNFYQNHDNIFNYTRFNCLQYASTHKAHNKVRKICLNVHLQLYLYLFNVQSPDDDASFHICQQWDSIYFFYTITVQAYFQLNWTQYHSTSS